ncbi:MAG: T9SS type A sorting domain-containing protein [Bacteroidia bacterium]|nr:T9SS type A sorting domain-containing protein [Bacteroidia bacterium]
MKLKSILLTAVTTLSLATATMAQVPNYVPTNGLVGWWPFTGNANDISGNNLNGTVTGATLTTDRFGNATSAYNFANTGQNIDFFSSNTWMQGSYSISFWFNSAYISGKDQYLLSKRTSCLGGSEIFFQASISPSSNNLWIGWGGGGGSFSPGINFTPNVWNNVIYVFNGSTAQLYLNGSLYGSSSNNGVTNTVMLRAGNHSCTFPDDDYIGKFDDLGLWNRALTQQEITTLYNATNCANNTTITPLTNSLSTGDNAIFTASTSDTIPSYVWQSDLGQGFQTLNNFGNYSGVNTATLNIANVQLPNHTQPIRVITTSGNCIDTSNVAVINILDTCFVTVYDTLLTTVTDTLIINATLTGLNPPSNLNTLKVYPNPANTHITIDYGNFVSMNGYTLKITNNLGQVVFTSPINQQSSYIDLSTWTGNGIYFVQIIDTQNNTIENRKIVLQ